MRGDTRRHRQYSICVHYLQILMSTGRVSLPTQHSRRGPVHVLTLVHLNSLPSTTLDEFTAHLKGTGPSSTVRTNSQSRIPPSATSRSASAPWNACLCLHTSVQMYASCLFASTITLSYYYIVSELPIKNKPDAMTTATSWYPQALGSWHAQALLLPLVLLACCLCCQR